MQFDPCPRISLSSGILLVLLFAGIAACPVFAQYSSRTDLSTVQLPSPLPVVGPAGSIVVDPDFGTRILRVTDSEFELTQLNSSFVTTTSGSADLNLWSLDSLQFLLSDANGHVYSVSFDPILFRARRLAGPFTRDTEFSRVTPGLIYSYSGTKLLQLDSLGQHSTLVADFASVLPAGFKAGWKTIGGIGGSDQVFAAGFGPDQNKVGYVATFDKQQGFHVLNTASAGFPLHNIKLARSGSWVVVAPEGPTDGPYFWRTNSTQVLKVDHIESGGHWSAGFNKFVNNNQSPMGQYAIRDFATPAAATNIIKSLPEGITSPLDQHSSWNNVNLNDTAPFFSSTTDGGKNSVFPAAWYNEVLGTNPNGSEVWRFGHTFNSGKSHYFSCAQAIISVDQRAKYILFTSDWMGQLGLDRNGNPRCDVFLMELK